MRTQAQITIYSLNDVVTSATAPSNPYTGQLWVNTSKSPPVTMVYNGTKWVEQNGTDTIRSNISTITEKQATFESNLDGLTSTVSETKKTVETISSDLDTAESNITSLQEDVSSLVQTTDEISAEVSTKVDSTYGSSSSTFGWSLKSDGFYIYSNASTVVSITSSGLSVSGNIVASSGTLSELTVIGKLYFGNNKSYYLSPNYNNASWYIYLKNFKVDETNAYFSGQLSAPSGNIGGFTISTSAIYSNSKTSYNSTTSGVYVGTSGIGLGAGTFYVTSAGKLYASDAEITGSVNATSGNFDNCVISSTCTIYGNLFMFGSEEVKFYGTKQTITYSTTMGGEGIESEIVFTSNGNISHSYIRPTGFIIVPNDYSTYSNDGMIFGIMETLAYNIQKLLTGVSYYYYLDSSSLQAQLLMRCSDITMLNAINDNGNRYISWGNTMFTSYLDGYWCIGDSVGYLGEYYVNSVDCAGLYGTWRIVDKLYVGESTSSYIMQVTISSTKYGCLYGNWYVNTQMYFGTTTTGYQTRIDQDQFTFYYNSTYIGEIESYTTYIDLQGTWRTNGSSWISSSDRNLKDEIKEIDDVYSKLFDKLIPVTYKWKEGTSGRTHIGFVAQNIKEATEACGLTTKEFAAYVHFDASEKNGEVIPETCGIRYEEITPLNTWEIQKLKKRVAELEDKIKAMEELE